MEKFIGEGDFALVMACSLLLLRSISKVAAIRRCQMILMYLTTQSNCPKEKHAAVGKASQKGSALLKLVFFLSLLTIGGVALFGRHGAGESESGKAAEASSASPFEENAKRTEEVFGPKVEVTAPPDDDAIFEQVCLGLLFLIAMGLCVQRVFVPLAERLSAPKDPLDGISKESKAALAEYAKAMKQNKAEIAAIEAEREERRFFEIAPEVAKKMKELFGAISKAPTEEESSQLVAALRQQLKAFILLSEAPSLAAIRRLAMAFENLLKQSLAKSPALAPSVLRTGAAALLQMESFSKKTLKVSWTSAQMPRFLVVDDNAISRMAVAASLKRAFSSPDVAEDGPGALKLAAEKPYDVIFLDVEMPGMDGFEVCSRLHELEANAKTPVVFVTSHTDYESRKKSVDAGGQDYVAKPFLAFEIIVKVMTIVIRAGGPKVQGVKAVAKKKRAQKDVGVAADAGGKQGLAPRETAAETDRAAASQEMKVISKATAAPVSEDKKTGPVAAPARAAGRMTPAKKRVNDSASPFLRDVADDITKLEGKVRRLWQGAAPAILKALLGDIYTEVHAMADDAAHEGEEPFATVARKLEKLLSTIYEQPNLATRSVLETCAAALSLLRELCEQECGEKHTLDGMKILIAEDNAVVRKALANMLQVRHGIPDFVQDGREAVERAAKNKYDVILMDIKMPEMDGLSCCSAIRSAQLNATAQIIFVTSSTDLESQAKCALHGGNAFISKPLMPAQIKLAVATYGLRGRLEALKHEAELPAPRKG